MSTAAERHGAFTTEETHAARKIAARLIRAARTETTGYRYSAQLTFSDAAMEAERRAGSRMTDTAWFRLTNAPAVAASTMFEAMTHALASELCRERAQRTTTWKQITKDQNDRHTPMQARTYTTRNEAVEREIIAAIEANGRDAGKGENYDVERIADKVLTCTNGRWHVSVDDDTFWSTIAEHEREDA